MPLAKELVLGYVTSLSSTTQNAMVAGAGQSFTVRNFGTGSAYLQDIHMLDSVGLFNTQIKSPKMHDSTYGIQIVGNPKTLGGTSVFNPLSVLPSYLSQKLYATDTLTWTTAGANADVVVGGLDIYYTDLSGIASRLYDWNTIRPLVVNLAGVTVTPTVNGTAGLWGTAAALNSGNYNLKANTDYAILGYQTELAGGLVGFQGIDTGNLILGGPASPQAHITGAYFVDQSVKYGPGGRGAQIPVFNSNNAAGFTVNFATSATSGTPIISVLCGQLSQLLPSPAAGS
jgi:hypothetical protein